MTKTFTFINCMGGDAFQVHRAGCRDIGKVRKNGQWNVEAVGVEAAIDSQVADFQADEMDYTAGDFRVLPCANEWPKELYGGNAGANTPTPKQLAAQRKRDRLADQERKFQQYLEAERKLQR